MLLQQAQKSSDDAPAAWVLYREALDVSIQLCDTEGISQAIDRVTALFDMDAIAFWELRNFGLGDQAAQREARSAIDQSRWRQIEIMDRVAREVVDIRAHDNQPELWKEAPK